MSFGAPSDTNRAVGVGRFLGMTIQEVTIADGPVTLVANVDVLDSARRSDESLDAGVLFTMIDCVGGVCGGFGALPDGWVVTTSLLIRSLPAIHAAKLRIESSVLRRGKTSIITKATTTSERGECLSNASVTSAILIPVDGVPVWERPGRIVMAPGPSRPTFSEWVNAQGFIDSASGRAGAWLELVEDLRNPWGIMHGGITSSLVDHGARRVVSAHLDCDAETLHTFDLALHFLSPARVGPVRAAGRVLGTRPDGTIVEIEVRDEGNDDRLVAFAIATVATR